MDVMDKMTSTASVASMASSLTSEAKKCKEFLQAIKEKWQGYYGLKNDPTKFHSCTLSMQTNDPIVPHDILQKGQPILPYSKWRPP